MLNNFSKLFLRNDPEQAEEKIKSSVENLNAKQRKKLAKELRIKGKSSESLTREFHLPGHKFVGPGTNLKSRLNKGDVPISSLDLGALKHDLYYSAGSQELRAESDLVLLKEALDILQNNPLDPSAIAVATAMTAKISLNKIGVPIPGLVGESKPKNVSQEKWERFIFLNRKKADDVYNSYIKYLDNKGVSYGADGKLKIDKSIIRSSDNLREKIKPTLIALNQLEENVKTVHDKNISVLSEDVALNIPTIKMSDADKKAKKARRAKSRKEYNAKWQPQVAKALNKLTKSATKSQLRLDVIDFVAKVRKLFRPGLKVNNKAHRDLKIAIQDFESDPSKFTLEKLIVQTIQKPNFKKGANKIERSDRGVIIQDVENNVKKHFPDFKIPNVSKKIIGERLMSFKEGVVKFEADPELRGPDFSSEASSERSEEEKVETTKLDLNAEIDKINEGLAGGEINLKPLENLAKLLITSPDTPAHVKLVAQKLVNEERKGHVDFMAKHGSDLVQAIVTSPTLAERLSKEASDSLNGEIKDDLARIHNEIVVPYEAGSPDLNKLFENFRASLGEQPPKIDGLRELAKKALTIAEGEDSNLEKVSKSLMADRAPSHIKIQDFLNLFLEDKRIGDRLNEQNRGSVNRLRDRLDTHFQLVREEVKEPSLLKPTSERDFVKSQKPVKLKASVIQKEEEEKKVIQRDFVKSQKPVKLKASVIQKEEEPATISRGRSFRSRRPIFDPIPVRPPDLPPTAKSFSKAVEEREKEIRKGVIDPKVDEDPARTVSKRAKQFDVVGEDQLESQDFQKTWPSMRMIQDKELKKEIDVLDSNYIKKDTANFSYDPVSMNESADSSLYKDGLMIDKLREETGYLIEGDVGLIKRVGMSTIRQMDTPVPPPPGACGLFLQASAGHSQSRLTAPTKYSGIINVPYGSERQFKNSWRELPYAPELDIPMSSIARTGAPPISMDPTWHSYLVPLETGDDLTREGFLNNPNIAPTVPNDNAYSRNNDGISKITKSSIDYLNPNRMANSVGVNA
jgi:hypothetical protein